VLPGTKYTAARVLRILLTRGWLIAVPVAGSALAARASAPRLSELLQPDLLLIAATAAAFIFGVALIVLMEYRDTSFRRENEVTRVLSLPVLAAVPLMTTRMERRAHRRRLAVSFGSVLALVGCAAIAVAWWRLQP
jgi:hypothetical protein